MKTKNDERSDVPSEIPMTKKSYVGRPPTNVVYTLRIIMECKACGTDTFVVVPICLGDTRAFCQQPLRCPECGVGLFLVITELKK